MTYDSIPDLVTAYLTEHLMGKASYSRCVYLAAPWIAKLTATPVRQEILARHKLKGRGHYQAGARQANHELALLRTIFRWGIYREQWLGGDPTAGIRKFKTAQRETSANKFQLITLLQYFQQAPTADAKRDRALYGLCLFTGCRPSEARTARLDAITPYLHGMGRWNKGMTKNGSKQVLPLPKQLMLWIHDWQQARPLSASLYLFPGQDTRPLSLEWVSQRWRFMREQLAMGDLWNYDLRRTLVTKMGSELNYSEQKIKAIINHRDRNAFGHYSFMDFDALVQPIQHWADWLCGLKQESNGGSREPVLVSASQAVPVQVPLLPPRPLIAPRVAEASEEIVPLALSGQERNVLVLLGQGLSAGPIAQALSLSVKTVNTYRARLMGKLQLTNTAQLIRYAIKNEADLPLPVPVQSTPLPVSAPAVMAPTIPVPVPIVPISRSIEREEWPG